MALNLVSSAVEVQHAGKPSISGSLPEARRLRAHRLSRCSRRKFARKKNVPPQIFHNGFSRSGDQARPSQEVGRAATELTRLLTRSASQQTGFLAFWYLAVRKIVARTKFSRVTFGLPHPGNTLPNQGSTGLHRQSSLDDPRWLGENCRQTLPAFQRRIGHNQAKQLLTSFSV